MPRDGIDMTLTPTLRKAAILISSLDARTGDALLEQIGEAQSQRVRDAVMELGDVPAEEQERILAEFDSRLSLRESSVLERCFGGAKGNDVSQPLRQSSVFWRLSRVVRFCRGCYSA